MDNKKSLRELVLEFMRKRSGNLSTEEVVEGVKEIDDSFKSSSISRELRRLSKRGKVRRVRRGEYRKEVDKSKIKDLGEFLG